MSGPILPSGRAPKKTWAVYWDGENVFINGPIDDKLLTIGCLEMAKKSVFDYDPLHLQKAPEGKPN